jgi:uncharacterized protein
MGIMGNEKSSGLRIYVADIAQDGERLEGEIPPEIADLADGEFIESSEPLIYKLDISVVSDELLVFGSLSVDLVMQCARCSAMFPVTVSEPAYCYNQRVEKTLEYVDLTADMREAIILAFSSYPVCSADCKGLCIQCGANLNNGECNCKPPVDDRWEGLEGLG